MVVEVRGLTGKDGRYLSNEKLVRDNEVEDYVLRNCVPTCIEEGVYHFEGKPIDWNKIFLGDSSWLLLAVRVETYPDEPYPCPLRCPAKLCRKKFTWDVDLEKFIAERTQPLSDEAKQIIRDGRRFELKIPDAGNKVWFKLKTRNDRKRFEAIQSQLIHASKKKRERQNDLVNGFLFFGTEIEGVDKKNADAKQDFLEGLPMRTLNKLRADMDKFDCGVDTTIEVECPHCGLLFEIELPLGRSFFLPDVGEKKKTTADLAKEATTTDDDDGEETAVAS